MFDIYEFSEQLQRVLAQNEILIEENYAIKQELKKYENRTDEQYKQMQKQIGSMLNNLVSK